MDVITKNKMDHLAMKVHMHLLKEAQRACSDISGADSLPERELEAIYERAVVETGVKSRVRLHAEVWVEDVVAKAKQLVNAATESKIKRVTTGGRHQGTTF